MNKQPKASGGYPLTALFLVLTACGIVAAVVGPGIRGLFDGTMGTDGLVVTCLTSAFVVMLLGAVIGTFHYRRKIGMLYGIITGGIIGILVCPIILAPRESMQAMLGLSIAGSVVVVMVGLAFRLTSNPAKKMKRQ